MGSQNLLELRKFVAPEVIYGAGGISLAGRYAKNFGGKKAMVVTDPGVTQAGWVEKVLDSLKNAGVPAVVFTEMNA